MTQLTVVRHAPQLSTAEAGVVAHTHFGLSGSVEALPSERDQNFLIREPSGARAVLKIANAGELRVTLEAQNAAMEWVASRDPSVRVPRVRQTPEGHAIAEIQGSNGRHLLRLLSYVPGRPLAEMGRHSPEVLQSLGWCLGRVTAALHGFTHAGARRALYWDLATATDVITRNLNEVAGNGRRSLLKRLLAQFEAEVVPALPSLRRSVIHNDANDYNVLVSDDERVVGLVDFGDMVESGTVFDLAVGAAYAALAKPDPHEAVTTVARAYQDVYGLEPVELALLNQLVLLRLCLSVTVAAVQTRQRPEDPYLRVSERAAWAAIEQLANGKGPSSPAPAPAPAAPPAGPLERLRSEAILEARSRHLGPGLSLHYDHPLRLVRGWMQYLYDEAGREYLDGVNNVCQVGHCHPRVVSAAARQMATLNTNTRYLYDELARYLDELTALFPAALRVCYLVCSGSEANELAIRLARTHTGRRDVVVMEHGYHGNTTTLVEISPYKYDGPGGAGRPPWVHAVTMPDTYRGEHRDPQTAGPAYAAEVTRAMREAEPHGGAAAFMCETIPGCGGHVVLPPGYLKEAYRIARAAGGVCIADEVQVGFGRVGTHWWGFETQGVVPDIVTLGKPIGNGHPMGAVITTPEIAASFDTGMEYFNTFGGNPVSCVVGLAVLTVLKEEGLRARARGVGERLVTELRSLADLQPAIGDVRGLGLFLGVELVRDRSTREPDAALAKRVVEAMRVRGVLVSTEGPHHNVLKIKPPLCFSEGDVGRFAGALGDALSVR